MGRSFLLLALCLAPAAGFAHDLWLERTPAGLALRYGHRGGAALALDAGKVKTLRCLPPEGGAPVDLRGGATIAPTELAAVATCAVAAAFLDGGTWSLTPDGEKNLPRSQVPDAVKAWQSRQFAKWLDVRSPLARAPLGERFEIVPVTDLATARTGNRATFRVLLDGQPVNGATVAIAHKPLGETDSAGEARVTIRATDVESVSASFRRPLRSPDADTEVWEASLTFEVAK